MASAIPALPVLLLPLLLALPATAAAACTPDYEACGTGVLSPVRNPPCCSPTFYCYTRGPYFSQCRPVREQQQQQKQQHASRRRRVRAPLCAAPFGVCAAGTAPSSAIPCCDPAFVCTPAPPLYSQCLPPPAPRRRVAAAASPPAAWFRLFPANRRTPLVSFQTHQWAARWARRGLRVERLAAKEKLTHPDVWVAPARLARPVTVVADIPLLHHAERDRVRRHVERAVGHGLVVSVARAVLVVHAVTGGEHRLQDVVATLAAFPHVRRVTVTVTPADR